MNIILLGPPGVGKGTAATKLSEKLNLPHIATGDMLRENVANKTKLGLRARDYMNKGLLVPDELVIEMMKERLTEKDAKKGFILDGFPRTINQADEIQKVINTDKVINLQANDEIIVKRLSRRRVCEKCGFNYHLDFMKPNREGYCDKCSGDLYQREDDKPEAVKQRLKVYREQTAPLISYYRNKNVLAEIDGSGSPEDVFKLITKAIA